MNCETSLGYTLFLAENKIITAENCKHVKEKCIQAGRYLNVKKDQDDAYWRDWGICIRW